MLLQSFLWSLGRKCSFFCDGLDEAVMSCTGIVDTTVRADLLGYKRLCSFKPLTPELNP
jgi:hypothetical protein